MKQKTKKQVTTILVLLLFLAGGLWYVLHGKDLGNVYEEKTSGVIGVLTQTAVQDAERKAAEDIRENSSAVADVPEQVKEVIVYVCGAVHAPGIYTLPPGGRLYEAVALAGGFSGEADTSYHNLARELSDGERVYILSYAETKELTAMQMVEGEQENAAEFQRNSGGINLNTATAEQLTSLPGIGDAKALAILEYRRKVGVFTDIEEIKNVSGIGEAMFEKIKDKIIVK